MKRIYLDNNATTGLDPKVLEAMLLDLNPIPANPSSYHHFGKQAKNLMMKARDSIAHFFHVSPKELIFTSGGTESLNLLIRGLHLGHTISSNIEHASVFHTLETLGNCTFLQTGLKGAVTPEQVKEAIKGDTRLIVLSAVNNETGVKTDIQSIAEIAHQAKIPLIVDAIALLGKEPFVIHPGITAMAFSAHKIHGPKGIGLSFLRSSHKLSPFLTGGDQEYNRRAGTENLAGILGFAKAIELLQDHHEMERLTQLLIDGLKDYSHINGEGPRICNTVNLSFPDLSGEDLLIQLDLAGIAVSHGSACSSGALEPSRILLNMGVPYKLAKSAIRFSLSRWNSEEEIEYVIKTIKSLIDRSHRN